MPTYCKCPAAEAGREPLPGLVEVQLTLGDDPVVLHCEPRVAARLFDARTIESAIAGQPAAVKQEYDRRLLTVLQRVRSAWPLREQATWPNLVDILNAVEFYSPNGRPWTKHNLMQKVQSLGFKIATVYNPDGAYGTLTVGAAGTADEEVARRAVESMGVRPFAPPPGDDGDRMFPAAATAADREREERVAREMAEFESRVLG